EKATKKLDTVKDKFQTKVAEVKDQFRQLGTPQLKLAGVNVGRITDTGTVGKNKPTPNPKPSNSSKPPEKDSKPAEGTKGIDKTVKPNDVVPYRPSNSPLENHHGVMDVWAKHNVSNYVSRGGNTPTIALTKQQHDATKAVYRQWLFEKTGKKVGGKVDWQSVSPKEIQRLTEDMFDAANVPKSARQEYYKAFNLYNYRE
ncbi:hypothetical protein, partial [Lysinibacillus mangiferihumi]|uniref:hypothetical protein n=1 Tax=Lysinibacillus mangiferihumi TaxID=1130819 RepID=UPI0020130616